jgi:hypothetical protein
MGGMQTASGIMRTQSHEAGSNVGFIEVLFFVLRVATGEARVKQNAECRMQNGTP